MIHYPRFQAVGLDQYARDHIVTHFDHLFFEKAVDWRDEREHRWLVCNESPDDVYLEFRSALSGVIFGQDCPPDKVRAAVRLARAGGGGVQFEQLKWRNSAPWLSFRLDWASL